MSAQQYNFSIEQGSSFELTITYTDNNGNPIDLTGWCGRITISRDDNIIDIFLTTNINLSLYKFNTDPLNGKLFLQIPATTTNEYSYNIGKYDLELESDEDIYFGGGKDIRRLLYGDITIIKRYSETSNLLDC
jgi:hypothetical protein